MPVYGKGIKTLEGLVKMPLAQPGDPYVRYDGTFQEDLLPEEKQKLPELRATALEYRPVKKRNMKELPAPIPVLNAVACVFMYTALGLGDREIAEALKLSKEQLDKVRAHTAYAECFEVVTSEIININSKNIHMRLAAMAPAALDNIFTIAQESKQDGVKLRANQDIMGRGGFTDKDQSKQGMNRGDLRIIITRNDEKMDVHIGGEGIE